MFSSRLHRQPLSAMNNSFTSFSSDNSYMPNRRQSSPFPLRQLTVRDLHDINETDLNNQSVSQIPRPILSIPRPSIRMPTDDLLWWTPDETSSYREEFPASRRYHPERPFYQITAPSTNLPSPPIQYQIVPISYQRSLPNRILHRIKHKKYFKEKTPGLCTTLCSGGLSTCAALVYLCIILALPVTKLVLGILYIGQCPVNKNIPLFMIVSGACGLGIILFLLLSSTCTFYRSSTIARKITHKFIICTIALSRGMQGALAIFLFVWFFIGNVWVFGARSRVRTDAPNDINNYCQPGLYWFAFYVLIFTYVFATFMCFIKFCGNFFCCGACDMWKRAFS
ncbi:unnamed protein product [Adineta steineri]|uniref:Uncharacterized protein n=1 Tax=Adineta steineri TaxID=433720 RepID=A0A813VCJ5_9BILA|nr:unnamed protein product [Adineta steineri]